MNTFTKAKDLNYNYRTLLSINKINTNIRRAYFFAQLHHESNLEPVAENLNYSAEALRRVFFRYFPNDTIAKQYARQPEKIANKVYADRMKNGNECSGDGWRYRGRGFIQITGKHNYTKLSIDSGIDYVNNPDLLLKEVDAMVSAVWFWNKNNINEYADADDVLRVTRRINGGTNGLNHRRELTKKYKEIFR